MVERFLHYWQTHSHESTWGKKKVIEIILNRFKIVDSCGMFLENKFSHLNHQCWSVFGIKRFRKEKSLHNFFLNAQQTCRDKFIENKQEPPFHMTSTASVIHYVRHLHKGRLIFSQLATTASTASTHIKTNLEAAFSPHQAPSVKWQKILVGFKAKLPQRLKTGQTSPSHPWHDTC